MYPKDLPVYILKEFFTPVNPFPTTLSAVKHLVKFFVLQTLEAGGFDMWKQSHYVCYDIAITMYLLKKINFAL